MLARNSLVNLLGQGAPLVVAVVALPVAIDGMGAARFGVLALAWLVLDYAAVFDLGLGRAATWKASEALGSGDDEALGAAAWTTGALQLGLATVAALILAAVTPTLVDRVLTVPAELSAETRASLYLIALALPAVFLFNLCRGLLEAAQRFDLLNAVRAPFGSLTFSLAAAAGLWGWTLPPLVGAMLASRVVALVIIGALTIRALPAVRRPRLPRLARAGALLGYGGWVTVSTAINPFLVHLERLVIGALLPIAMLGLYTPAAEVVRRLLIVPDSVRAVLFPAYGRMAARPDDGGLVGVTARAWKYLVLILGVVAGTLATFAEPLFGAWLGPAFRGDPATALQVLALGFFLNGLASLPSAVLDGTGRPDIRARFHIVELPLYAVAVVYLVGSYGIVGAAWAWTGRVAVDALLLYGVVLRRTPGLALAAVRERVPHAVLLVTLPAIALTAIRLGQEPGGVLFLWALLAVVLVAAIGWRGLLSAGERRAIMEGFGPDRGEQEGAAR